MDSKPVLADDGEPLSGLRVGILSILAAVALLYLVSSIVGLMNPALQDPVTGIIGLPTSLIAIAFFLSGACAALLIPFLRDRKNKSVAVPAEARSLWPLGTAESFLMVGVVSALLTFWQFAFISHAVGFDTPVYASYLEYAYARGFPAGVFWSLMPSSYGAFSMLWLPARATGLTSDQIFIIAPWVLMMVYAASTWFFVKESSRNNELAILSTIFVPVSFFTLRLTMDLLRNLLSLSLFFLVLGLTVSYDRGGRKRVLITAVLLSWGIAYLYSYAWAILGLTIVIYARFSYLQSREQRIIRLMDLAVVPVVALLVVRLLIPPFLIPPIIMSNLTFSKLSLVMGSTLALTTPAYWAESLIMGIVATSIAILAMIVPARLGSLSADEGRILLMLRSLLISITAGLVTVIYISLNQGSVVDDVTARVLYYVPMPILFAIAVKKLKPWHIHINSKMPLLTLRNSSMHPNHRQTSAAVALLILTLLGIAFIETTYTRVTYYPSQEEVATLKWIRGSYGANILIITRINTGAEEWVPLIIGWRANNPYDLLYWGSIADLLSGKPTAVFYRTTYLPSQLKQLTVLIINQWYHVGPSEYSRLTNITGPPLVVYKVRI